MADVRRLREELPADFQEVFARAQAMGSLNSPPYQIAVWYYYRRYFCRSQPWPKSLERSFSGTGYGIYGTLWGPSPFECTGTLRHYDASTRLSQITSPVLFTCGEHDFATPESTAEFHRQLPQSQLAVFPNSSHVPHIEQSESYLSTIRKFLHRAEPAVFPGTGNNLNASPVVQSPSPLTPS